MSHLTVSAVIPSHNRGHLIEKALGSAMRDLGPDDEILVIDDGSTDDTESVVEQLRDGRVRYIWQPRSGAGAARNRGTREATRDLIAYLDSDDQWLPGKTELQRRYLAAKPDVLVCFTDLARDFKGRRRALSRRYWHTDPRSWEEIMGPPIPFSSVASLPAGTEDFGVYTGDMYRAEMHTNYFSTICLMARRKEACDALHFTEGISTFEDWECIGRLTSLGPVAYLDHVGSLQVKHPGPRVTDANWLARADSRLAVLKNVWGADQDFLETYGEEYRATVREQRVAKVHGLISLGKAREARDEIRSLRDAPITYRLLSQLPSGLLVTMVSLRRALNTHLTTASD